MGFGVVLFCGFYGFSYVIQSESLDVNTLIDRFEQYYSHFTLNDYVAVLNDFFKLKAPDILEPTVRFLVSRFTGDYRFFLATLGFFFGILYVKNIKELLAWSSSYFDFKGALLFIGVITVISPDNGVNQFRFWTAAMLLLYGVFRYIRTQNWKNLLISGLAILSHIGLLAVLAPMIFWFFTRNNSKLHIILILISFAFTGLDLTFLANSISFLGEAFGSKFTTYTSDFSLQRAAELQERVWYAVWWRRLVIYSGSITLLLIYRKNFQFFSLPLKQFFSLTLFLVSLTNFYSSFPLNFRYQTIATYCIMSFLFVYNAEVKKTGGARVIFLTYFPVLLLIAINMKSFLQAFNAYLLISNPILHLFIGNQTSLWDLLG